MKKHIIVKDKTISHEDVKEWSEMYNIPNEDIYRLDAEYVSRLRIANQDRQAGEPEADGIPVQFFCDTSKILKEKHPLVSETIMRAMDMPLDGKCVMKWDNFLKF